MRLLSLSISVERICDSNTAARNVNLQAEGVSGDVNGHVHQGQLNEKNEKRDVEINHFMLGT